MLAVSFKNRNVSLVTLPVPEPGEDEALVKMLMAGICATDVEIFEGYAAFAGVPGHEFVGVVEQCAAHPDLVGERVVADINCGCGKCMECLRGDPRHCPDRRVIGIRGKDGAFAEYCAVPARNLHVVPDRVETLDAVFAEPLAAALEISQQVHITNRTRIAVLGDGKLGLLAAIGLSHFSGRVLLLGRHPRKLEIAEHQGVATFQVKPDASPEAVVRQFGKCDITVDATGNPDGINMAIALTRPEGIIVVKTTLREQISVDLAAVAVNELQIVGSRCGDPALALRFLENRWIDVAPLVEAVYPLSRFNDAFSHAMRKESLKVLVAADDPDVMLS